MPPVSPFPISTTLSLPYTTLLELMLRTAWFYDAGPNGKFSSPLISLDSVFIVECLLFA